MLLSLYLSSGCVIVINNGHIKNETIEGLSKRNQIVIYSEKRLIWLRGSPSRKISTMDLRSDPQNLGFLWITESAGKKAQRDTFS